MFCTTSVSENGNIMPHSTSHPLYASSHPSPSPLITLHTKMSALLYILTTVTSPTLTPKTYNTWYDTVHIPELLSIPGGPNAAYRYKSTNPENQKWHFLTLYPLNDIAFTRDPAIRERISSHHPVLPEGKSIWELVVLEGRDYVAVNVGDGKGLKGGKKWVVTMEVDGGEEGVEGLLNGEDGEYGRYRIHRAPTAITGVDTPEIPVPMELVIYELDKEEDIERLISTLHKTSESLQINIQCSSWESI